jgi:hypothetical protein
MSRIVPEDRPLSDEDRIYLVERGTKQGLIERLDAEFPPEEAESKPEPDEYDKMTKDQLMGLLEERKLSKSGNKDEVIARLRADDARQ